MRRCLRPLWGLLAAGLVLAAGAGYAQNLDLDPDRPVALVADSVTYDTNSGIVTAEGAVEVYYGDRTLTADRIVYDSTTDRIAATGGLVLRDPSGDVTVFADAADLDTRLRDGLVEGARAVMGEHVKLAAVEARRVDDRYNALSKAVYSPCVVCASNPTPVWRIRARRVIHDELERTIHYENATFDLFGVPVLWTPYFSHADPTVRRQTGFLVPKVFNSTTFGYGARAPFYWVIDEQSDATFEPFITSDDGLILIGEYRRRFTFGDFEIGGSATFDDYEGSTGFHGNLEATGAFETRTGIDYGFDIDVVTDDPYLKRYEFSDDDRLESVAYVRDYSSRGFFDLAAVYFQSLRDNEPSGDIPYVLPDFAARYTFDDPLVDGRIGLFADTQALIRTDGDDSSRVTLGADWERDWLTDFGLALTPFAEARVDFFATGSDATLSDDTGLRFAPLAGIEARYPLINDSRPGVTHVLEPVIQAIVAPYGGNDDVPNEDSLLTEFDETSLFERNHFTGLDGVEEGPRLNLGLRYERVSDSGLDLDASLGRVLRPREADEFSLGSGLVNASSDWVGAWAVSFAPYVAVRQRLRLSDDFELTRNEVYGGIELDPVGLDVGYIFLEADPRIDAPSDREEISAAARLKLTDNWTLGGFVQRDINRGEFVETTGSLGYRNECLEIDFQVKRSFTDREDAPGSTSLGLEVRLLTLGTDVGDGSGPGTRCTPQWRG